MDRSKPGRVIVLNGASSSGKSSVARELQRQLPDPHLFAGIDSFTSMLRPDGHIGMPWHARRHDNAGWPEAPLRWVFPEEPDGAVAIEFGERGHTLVRGMHRALAALAAAGNNVIFEHVFLYPEWPRDLAQALDGVDAYLVAVHCPLAVIAQRERARGNRVAGQARSHHRRAHEGIPYDVEVDTSAGSAAEAAAVIAARLRGGPPAAFSRLRGARPG